MGFKLLDFFVELSAKGLPEVKQAFGAVNTAALATKAAADQMGVSISRGFTATALSVTAGAARMGASLRQAFDEHGAGAMRRFANVNIVNPFFVSLMNLTKGLRDALSNVGRTAQIAFGLASVGLLGFIRAGLAGTAEGNYLSLQMQLLSREIASVFLPAIRAVITFVRELTALFRSLSQAQANSLMKWTLITAAVVGLSTVLPSLTAGLLAVAKGMGLVAAGLVGVELAAAPLIIVGLAIIGAFVVLGIILWDVVDVFLKAETTAEGFANALKAVWEWVKVLIPPLAVLGMLQAKGMEPEEALKGPLRPGVNILGRFGKRLGLGGGEGDAEREKVKPAAGGFEAIEQSFQRLAMVAGSTDIGEDEKQTGLLGSINEGMQNLIRITEGNKTPFAPGT